MNSFKFKTIINKQNFTFHKNKGNNMNIQQLKNALNFFLLDSYENIKNIQSNKHFKDHIFLSFLKNSKFYQNIYNINDFIYSHYYIIIENKENNKSICLLLPKNKIDGKNVNIKELLLNEINNSPKEFIWEIE